MRQFVWQFNCSMALLSFFDIYLKHTNQLDWIVSETALTQLTAGVTHGPTNPQIIAHTNETEPKWRSVCKTTLRAFTATPDWW